KLWTAAADDIKASSSSAYIFGSETTTRKEFDLSGDKLQLGIAHSSSATIHEARLDYIAINYPRQLKLRNGYLQFWLNQSSFSLSSTTASTRVWDVTDPLNITGLTGRNAKYTNEYTGQRSYVAWDDNATLPSPKFVSNVNNQDLHSLPTPEMVIFTLPEWQSQAERLAQLHIDRDSMAVAVINVNDVYNEFSSGSPDPGAFRRLLKMFYDRGNASKESTKLKYAILMGRSIFDNRRLTANSGTVIYPTMPSWQSNTGLDENDSFTTDDFFGFLADGSGSAPGASQLDIAVGRMPVRSLEDARNAVDKLVQYYDAMPKGAWKNRVMLISDDEDRGQHMTQTERLYQALLGTQYGSELMVDKIYIDAYDKVSNGYPGARADMFRLLDEGVWWWNYVGHANMSGWTHEQFLTSNDLNQMYYRRYPILYAATCDFLRWDQANISGAEIMWQTQGGGVIAAISATRPVY
ncbi:MAG: hypothetical protein K2L81_01345, partial [Muribaculaceae bacterium]|nr:hypothetical protein [Muribaculaceae bacterium]